MSGYSRYNKQDTSGDGDSEKRRGERTSRGTVTARTAGGAACPDTGDGAGTRQCPNPALLSYASHRICGANRISEYLLSLSHIHDSSTNVAECTSVEQLEAQQEALRAGAESERSAFERRSAELGAALDEVRAKLAMSEAQAARGELLATQMKHERDHTGTRY